MSLLRRIVTFATGLALLQGNLAAVHQSCATGHGTDGGEHSTMGSVVSDAGGMAHAAMAHAAMAQGIAAEGRLTGADREQQCDHRDHRDHRDHPDDCASMVSCVAVGTPAVPADCGDRRPEVALAIVTKSDVPISRTLLPEVPPPRV